MIENSLPETNAFWWSMNEPQLRHMIVDVLRAEGVFAQFSQAGSVMECAAAFRETNPSLRCSMSCCPMATVYAVRIPSVASAGNPLARDVSPTAKNETEDRLRGDSDRRRRLHSKAFFASRARAARMRCASSLLSRPTRIRWLAASRLFV